MNCWPGTGFDGLAMVRFPAMVTRKSLPREASIAIVGASVRLTTAGATAACSTVVAATANTPLARRARALPPPAASAGDPPASKAPPAVPAAAAPTAPLKTFRRLSAVRRPVPSVPAVPLGSGPAASGRGTGEWRDMIGSFSGPDVARPATRRLSGQSGSHAQETTAHLKTGQSRWVRHSVAFFRPEHRPAAFAAEMSAATDPWRYTLRSAGE